MQVLDHGFVTLVESWGSDERIIEAARMSTQKGFEGWGPKVEEVVSPQGEIHTREVAGDEKLLGYLYRNNHATPFEMGGAVIEVQAPIFIFREWHRHRTQSYNEMSARYAPLPDLNYVPTTDRMMLGGGHLTKQAGSAAGADALTVDRANELRAELDDAYKAAEATYQHALAAGAPKELARLVLPVGRYSRMRASANLRNWLGFLSLRMAPQAQWEIRQYADAVHKILSPLFPRTLALFNEKEQRTTSPKRDAGT